MKTGAQLVAEAKAKIQELTVQQLAALLQTSQARIIDVREPARVCHRPYSDCCEYAQGRVGNAVATAPSSGRA